MMGVPSGWQEINVLLFIMLQARSPFPLFISIALLSIYY